MAVSAGCIEGWGWLACDNLISAQVVTAGRRAGSSEHPRGRPGRLVSAAPLRCWRRSPVDSQACHR